MAMAAHVPPGPRSNPSAGRRSSTTVTVKGFLAQVDEEDGDAFTGLALITEDEDEYYLVGESKVDALARHVDGDAIVWGALEQGDDGKKFLRVSNFQIVHWSED